MSNELPSVCPECGSEEMPFVESDGWSMGTPKRFSCGGPDSDRCKLTAAEAKLATVTRERDEVARSEGKLLDEREACERELPPSQSQLDLGLAERIKQALAARDRELAEAKEAADSLLFDNEFLRPAVAGLKAELAQLRAENAKLRTYAAGEEFRSDYRTAAELRAAYEAQWVENQKLREEAKLPTTPTAQAGKEG